MKAPFPKDLKPDSLTGHAAKIDGSRSVGSTCIHVLQCRMIGHSASAYWHALIGGRRADDTIRPNGHRISILAAFAGLNSGGNQNRLLSYSLNLGNAVSNLRRSLPCLKKGKQVLPTRTPPIHATGQGRHAAMEAEIRARVLGIDHVVSEYCAVGE